MIRSARTRKPRHVVLLMTAAAALISVCGCHSAFVQATVVNGTGKSIHLFEVDYPNASFGGGELAAGGTFRYRFKVLGGGGTKLLWTDADEHDHTAQGPELHEGQEGTLRIDVLPAGPKWDLQVHDVHH